MFGSIRLRLLIVASLGTKCLVVDGERFEPFDGLRLRPIRTKSSDPSFDVYAYQTGCDGSFLRLFNHIEGRNRLEDRLAVKRTRTRTRTPTNMHTSGCETEIVARSRGWIVHA